MSKPENEPVGLPFLLYDYEHWGIGGEVNKLIESGQLPYDTFFRLASVGHKADEVGGNPSMYLNYILMIDIVEHAETPDQMRADTQELLSGDLPNAIVDVNSSINYPAYARLDPMYYRMKDLAKAIKGRRLANGQALPERPFDRRLHTGYQDEWSRCRGIARPLWRLIVQRSHPEWLETPEDYFPSAYIGTHANVYSIGEKSMKRGIVGHAVLSDPLVMSIYEEAIYTGVKGIGPAGKGDLRILLSEEHPELF